MDYEQLKIQSYKHWDIFLHENQCYIGRTFILLKSDAGIDDFLAIDGEIRDEFFKIGAQIKRALKTLFQPDKMNYAALSNTSEKIHVHVVPRYKEPRTFNGTTFIDQRWGKNYAPYDRAFVIEMPILISLCDTLKKHL